MSWGQAASASRLRLQKSSSVCHLVTVPDPGAGWEMGSRWESRFLSGGEARSQQNELPADQEMTYNSGGTTRHIHVTPGQQDNTRCSLVLGKEAPGLAFVPSFHQTVVFVLLA